MQAFTGAREHTGWGTSSPNSNTRGRITREATGWGTSSPASNRGSNTRTSNSRDQNPRTDWGITTPFTSPASSSPSSRTTSAYTGSRNSSGQSARTGWGTSSPDTNRGANTTYTGSRNWTSGWGFNFSSSHRSSDTPHRYTANAAPYARTWINPVNWFYNPSPVIHYSSPSFHVFTYGPEARLASCITGAILGLALMSLALDPFTFVVGLVISAVSTAGIIDAVNRF